jgi:hypothetical protein
MQHPAKFQIGYNFSKKCNTPLSANHYQLSFEKVLHYTFFVQKFFVSKKCNTLQNFRLA